MKLIIKPFFSVILLLTLGYLLALLTFRCNIWIEHPIDNYAIKYSMFPFSRSIKLPSTYFSRYQTKNIFNKKNKQFIGSLTIFPFLDPEAITSGEQYLRTVNSLNFLDKRYHFTNEQKKIIENNFYYLIEMGDIMMTRKYIMQLQFRCLELLCFTNSNTKIDLTIPKEMLIEIENKKQLFTPQ